MLKTFICQVYVKLQEQFIQASYVRFIQFFICQFYTGSYESLQKYVKLQELK
jgi:hypothetical protein